MNSVAIYMEGGGNTHHTKAALRQGMDSFLIELKELARDKAWRWKLVCCGGRNQAFKAFSNAKGGGEEGVVVLLVDAEAFVKFGPRDHLVARDKWDLENAEDNEIHLMVQTMETWIVADQVALQEYYGQRFNLNALPKADNLETVTRKDIASALERATGETQKGAYHKIRHASDLLKRINPQIVSKRCPGCARLFDDLRTVIQRA